MVNLQVVRRQLGRCFTEPVVKLLMKTPITPDGLTWFGLLVAIAAGVLVATGHCFAAGWVVIFSGLFDLLDGALARLTNRTTRFGAVLDSTLDRLGEAAILFGILVLFVRNDSLTGVIISGFAIIGSQLVSYIRARAEGIGIDCEVGVFTRPERIAILALGLLLNQFNPVLLIMMGLMAVLSWITAGQRLFHVWKKTKSN